MSDKIKKAGVMGWPIEHSLSPRLHGYWLKKHNIEGSYVALAIKPDNLRQALKILAAKGFRGVNLTVPHKESGLKIADHIEPLAQRIGAVNTILVRDDGTLEGRNTDAYGFTQNLLAAGFVAARRPVTLLGAGGAARAALVALIDMGFNDIRIVNRTRARASQLAKAFPQAKITVFAWDDSAALKDSMLLVNATSLGMKGIMPLEPSLDTLSRDAWVMDMVYTPLATGLLVHAKKRGHKTVDGLGMLLHQARPAFKAFFGTDPMVTDELRAYVLEGL